MALRFFVLHSLWPGLQCLEFTYPAAAAVRACKPILISAVYEANDEISAKRLALDDWKAQAQQYGVSHLSFRLANHGMIRCASGAEGTYLCRACGGPCFVRQVPPAGWVLYRRAWKNHCLPYMEALQTMKALRDRSFRSESEVPKIEGGVQP